MIDISHYTDYRKFLADYYNEAKLRNHGFSYQVFAEKAGFNSKGFLFNVIAGKRNLSRAHVIGLVEVMKLNKNQAGYFENLVGFNQAKKRAEKNFFFERLSAIKASGRSPWKPQLVRNDQYEFYSAYHHSVVRSLIGLYGFKGDYNWLSRRVTPRITSHQARLSVELLLRLGLIKRHKDGSHALTNASIATPAEVKGLAVLNFHYQALELARQSLNSEGANKRNITGCTLGISKQGYARVCQEIQELRARLLQIAEADQDADRVYQVNFQAFPVSQNEDNHENHMGQEENER